MLRRLFLVTCFALASGLAEAETHFQKADRAFREASSLEAESVPTVVVNAGYCVSAHEPDRLYSGLLCLHRQEDPVLGTSVMARRAWDVTDVDFFIQNPIRGMQPHPCYQYAGHHQAKLRRGPNDLIGDGIVVRASSDPKTGKPYWMTRRPSPLTAKDAVVCWYWVDKIHH